MRSYSNNLISNSVGLLRTVAVLLVIIYAPMAHAKHILIYGDSLSAAYGIDEQDGWVALLQESLGADYTLSNASISGETSTGGLARIDVTLETIQPDLVILELGANDGLTGGSIDLMKRNLSQMIERIQASGSELVLVGISVPPSYGPRYIDAFRAVYTELAESYSLPFIDFYREEFFLIEGLIQSDGLHPTAKAQPMVRDLMLNFLVEKGLVRTAP